MRFCLDAVSFTLHNTKDRPGRTKSFVYANDVNFLNKNITTDNVKNDAEIIIHTSNKLVWKFT